MLEVLIDVKNYLNGEEFETLKGLEYVTYFSKRDVLFIELNKLEQLKTDVPSINENLEDYGARDTQDYIKDELRDKHEEFEVEFFNNTISFDYNYVLNELTGYIDYFEKIFFLKENAEYEFEKYIGAEVSLYVSYEISKLIKNFESLNKYFYFEPDQLKMNGLKAYEIDAKVKKEDN